MVPGCHFRNARRAARQGRRAFSPSDGRNERFAITLSQELTKTPLNPCKSPAAGNIAQAVLGFRFQRRANPNDGGKKDE
jgi:hypothetical protein